MSHYVFWSIFWSALWFVIGYHVCLLVNRNRLR